MYYIVKTKDLHTLYGIQFYGSLAALKEKAEKGHGLVVESISRVNSIQFGMCQKRLA